MKLKCKKCLDIIEGDGKGTYITCSCKAIAIDETKYYVRYIGNFEDFEEVKEYDGYGENGGSLNIRERGIDISFNKTNETLLEDER